MHLLLVRHGITQHNIEGLYTGQYDAPLTELGERQAIAVGNYLAGEKIDVIFSSDLQRARRTAQAIAEHHNLPVLEDADLREINMGEWENHSGEQIRQRNLEEWNAVRQDPINVAPTGGETFRQLSERASRITERCLEEYPDQTVLWVTHGGFIQSAICHAMKLDLSYRHCFRHYNTSVSELHFRRDLPWIIRLNDIAHLRFSQDDLLVESS